MVWCDEKRRYPTRVDAQRAIARDRTFRRLRAYHCPVHQCWHLTHTKNAVNPKGDPYCRDWPLDKETT